MKLIKTEEEWDAFKERIETELENMEKMLEKYGHIVVAFFLDWMTLKWKDIPLTDRDN